MAKGKKTGGRTKGTFNKDVAPLRKKVNQLFEGYSIADMKKDLRALDPKERLTIMAGLAEFVIPKLQRTEIQGEIETKEVQTFTMFGRKIVF